jgi:hypothetical protein
MRSLFRAIPVALLFASLLALLVPRGAHTVPLYATRTGLMCQSCHFDPNGGGPRNEFGFAFAKNRHSLESEDSTSQWKDLNLTNRIGENMPVYLGLNHRFMLLASTSIKSDSLDRFGFFNMENQFHIAFQPHARLTLVYTRDGFNAGSQSREAYGMIGGLPLNGYLKLGRIMTPFGLRMDDHTVATRGSFLFISSGERFLPYDSREPDMGLEYGMERVGIFGRASFTNGRADPLGRNRFAETVALKLGYNSSYYQGAFSFYDDYAKEKPSGITDQRLTRWGYYALTHFRSLAAIGEIAAGTDESQPVPPSTVRGLKTNRLAGFGELNYALGRSINLRGRYDYFVTNRSSDKTVRRDATHDRWGIGGEWVPVPFAEIRMMMEWINQKDPTVKDNTEAYLQAHFSY